MGKLKIKEDYTECSINCGATGNWVGDFFHWSLSFREKWLNAAAVFAISFSMFLLSADMFSSFDVYRLQRGIWNLHVRSKTVRVFSAVIILHMQILLFRRYTLLSSYSPTSKLYLHWANMRLLRFRSAVNHESSYEWRLCSHFYILVAHFHEWKFKETFLLENLRYCRQASIELSNTLKWFMKFQQNYRKLSIPFYRTDQ